jgi:hypothetical protein
LSTDHRHAAEKARETWLATCGPLKWDEFANVSLSVGSALGYLKNEFDWDLMVTITLVYRDGLDGRKDRNRLTFDLGAGQRPGIVTRKPQGIELCNFGGRARGVRANRPCNVDGGEDCILDVPSLKELDAARPAAVVASQRTAPVAWCFGEGFDPPSYWDCTSSEKSCAKQRAAKKRDEDGDYKVRTNCTKTETLHCFTDENERTVCAPDGSTCSSARKEWTNLLKASPCEVATTASLEASNKRVE